MAAGFFLFKTLNLSVFRKGNQAAFAGTANPGNWTVAGACGPGAAGFFIFKLLNLSVFRKGNQAAFAALGILD